MDRAVVYAIGPRWTSGRDTCGQSWCPSRCRPHRAFNEITKAKPLFPYCENEKVRLITKSSLVKMDTTVNQERLKEKVDANASTKEKKERKTSPLMADAFVFDAFQDWEKMRKQIKKPLTDLAKTRAVNKLEKLSGGDKDKAIAILEQSTDHCWQDLYELKTEDEPPAKTADLPPNRSAKVQTAYGFGTERKDVDYNKMVWERIRQGWAEQEQEGEE